MVAVSLISTAAVAAGGAFAVRRKASARAARAARTHPPAGQFIDVQGTRIHALVEGEGPEVVLIHGANGSLRDFTFGFMSHLASRYRVIAFDRPGLGWSGRGDPRHAGAFAGTAEDPIEQAGLLAAAARQLGAERPIVLGHSFGGIVALAWALEHDPAAIVSLAGVANPWPGRLDPIYRLCGNRLGGALAVPLISAFASEARIRRAVDGVFAPQPAPPGYAEHMGIDSFVRPDVFRANARQVNRLRPHVVRMAQRYDDLSLPIEILHGDRDSTVPIEVHSRPLADRLATAHLTILEGIGHMPHHVRPDAAVAAVDRAATRAGLR